MPSPEEPHMAREPQVPDPWSPLISSGAGPCCFEQKTDASPRRLRAQPGAAGSPSLVRAPDRRTRTHSLKPDKGGGCGSEG